MIRIYFSCLLLVALGLAPLNASATLYEDEYIRIDTPDLFLMDTEADRKLWCMDPRLDVLYKMPQEEKDSTITLQYITPIIYDIVSKNCDDLKGAVLTYYPYLG